MKLDLSLESTFGQIVDLAYQGKTYRKGAFLCASIDDRNFQTDPNQDEYVQLLAHLKMNILPELRSTMDGLFNPQRMSGIKYIIHDIGGEKGKIKPHVLMIRSDLKVLTEIDCLYIQILLSDSIKKINASSKQQDNLKASVTFFSNEGLDVHQTKIDTPGIGCNLK